MDRLEHRSWKHGRSAPWIAGFALAVALAALIFATAENSSQFATTYAPIVDEVKILPPGAQPPALRAPLEP